MAIDLFDDVAQLHIFQVLLLNVRTALAGKIGRVNAEGRLFDKTKPVNLKNLFLIGDLQVFAYHGNWPSMAQPRMAS